MMCSTWTVCVRMRDGRFAISSLFSHTHLCIWTHTHIYTYIYICMQNEEIRRDLQERIHTQEDYAADALASITTTPPSPPSLTSRAQVCCSVYVVVYVECVVPRCVEVYVCCFCVVCSHTYHTHSHTHIPTHTHPHTPSPHTSRSTWCLQRTR
jgi:hypothetical protein